MVSNGFFSQYKKCVIFGGAGFIGCHMARFMLDHGFAGQIYLADIRKPNQAAGGMWLDQALADGRIRVVAVDVRQPVDNPELPSHADLVFNLAAVHREPGHEAREYFETNILGAQNVCNWADQVGCSRVVFTSSISPYGPVEMPTDEKALTVPLTPYGSSKLVAEKIHEAWLAADSKQRRLVIVRPGVVFGPGEGGNVTRMVRAVLGRYFFYMGNRDTIKAGIYVKELCGAIAWALGKVENEPRGVLIFNGTFGPPPTVEKFANTILKVVDRNLFIPTVPFALLFGAATLIDVFMRPLGVRHPFSPVRIRKLVRSNYIVPGRLMNDGYQYSYTLEQALADWRDERPSDWGL
ncbi:MAG: NAD(P)-dependent oxidoreductase [Oxalobacteraceae bacterium]|nr:NAD(P)-dependent oxidoreductase [Oxalobacteraceae bacterium]